MDQPTIRILIVEDSRTDVFLVQDALDRMMGVRLEISRVDRLAAALIHVQSRGADIILLDLGLPDAQGLDTFLSASTAMPEIPIIVLSGLSDEDVAIQCVQKGAQDYLMKGAALREILPRALRYALERHRAQHQLAAYARDLSEKNSALEEELRMARSIQQRLLSRSYPQFFDSSGQHPRALRFAHSYTPAASLSGDFFHILRLSNNQAGVLICDVMGHGVSAALLGALTRGFMDQFMPIAYEPGLFLKYLNRELTKTLKQSGIQAHASALYCVADVNERQVRYANAGHPCPLLLRRDARRVEWLEVERPRQPPLGLMPDTDYPTYSTALLENDALLLFTNGLSEQENTGGERFGHDRILQAVTRAQSLPCKQLLDELLLESRSFCGREEFDDDVCLVGMDVIERPSLRALQNHLS